MFILNIEWGSVADWASVFGTISAAIVSLFLANHHKKPRLIFELKPYNGGWNIKVTNPEYEPVYMRFTGDIKDRIKIIYLESYAKAEAHKEIPIIFNKGKNIAKVKIREAVSKHNYYLTLVIKDKNKICIFESRNKYCKGKKIYSRDY